ncbi:hypothetical protein TTHERM_01207720 (macronuclear) [Tetrahymena thermophila SB210]|uniref:Uncharacterized protein n=1 Tax=Tetrahymena thermophila (strain SB210) TaxID=312017 RepID=Q23YQ0_TETTS|nr:hypothetical protein TTHERM_01207720 [Tetrahymena thermophila SB210]EAS01672.1 hypothetical protein TTHERM_01207720 [Tetrahymena thermophila SB210]|eukprot:XP_001021917.1 hypothetical protein TTHERM_01207720 [Tetrahymena thermophila SB210]
MYLRKWSRMEWWDSVRYFKKYNLLDYKEEHRLLHLFPPTWQQYLPTKADLREVNFRDKQDKQLVKVLFQKYPDLRYDTSGRMYDKDGGQDNYANYVVRFILKQKEYMKRGMSANAAFIETEKIFQDRMQRKIDQNNLTRGIAINNRARSFMNFYQQMAEREARWKVQRMKRDVQQYLHEREIFEKEINDDGDMEDDFAEEENIYNRVLLKFQNAGMPEITKQDEKVSTQREFIERSENMFKVYYERAAIYDRLQGLTDSQIRSEIQNSPAKMKKRTRNLVKKLERLGVVLKQDGEVDFSAVKNTNLRNKLEKDSNIKIALMLKDLEFEFPHKEHQMDQAVDLKQKLQEVQDLRRTYVKDIMEIAGQPFKMKEPMPSYEQTHDTSDEQAERAREAKKLGEQLLEKAYTDSLLKPILQSPATYKLFETYDERILRIEEKWLRRQIKNADPTEDVSEKEEKLQVVIDKLRRTKYKIDQLSMKHAQDLMFEEHEVYGKDILIDEKVGYEDLRDYLFQPSEIRRKTELDVINDNKIQEMIKISTIKEDLVNPYNNEYASKLNLQDTIEYQRSKQEKIKTLRAEKEREEKDLEKLDALQRFDFEQEDGEDSSMRSLDKVIGGESNLMGSVSKKKGKASKEEKSASLAEEGEEGPVDEKKKILEFIKKANEKKGKSNNKSSK